MESGAPDAIWLGDLEQPLHLSGSQFPFCAMRKEHDDIPKPFLICDWRKEGEGGVEIVLRVLSFPRETVLLVLQRQ